MKNIKKMGFLICLFFISISVANAKEIIMTCEYYKAADQLSPYPGNQPVGVLCNIYNNYSHQCYMEVGSETATTSSNKEKVENWGSAIGLSWKAKDYVQNNNKCPDYMLIRLENGAIFNAGGYELHMAENMSDLMELQGELSDQRYPATLKGMQVDDNKKKKAEEEIKNYTDSINNTINNYSIETCMEKDQVITKYSKCKDILSTLKSNISTWDINVLNYINQSYFKEEDQIIKDYRTAVEAFETFLDNAEKELEEKNKELQDELGISEEEQEEEEKVVEPEKEEENQKDNSKNAIDLAFCHQDGVKKVLRFFGTLLLIAKILVPILLIVFGIVDYAKATIASASDAISKATKNLVSRIAAAVIIFILPTIINFVFSAIVKNNANYNQCRACIFERKC